MRINALIVLLFIACACGERDENLKDPIFRNNNNQSLIDVFLSDPLAKKYLTNADWKEELVTAKSIFTFKNSIYIQYYSIRESKYSPLPFVVFRVIGTKGFCHVFTYNDMYYYLYYGKPYLSFSPRADSAMTVLDELGIDRYENIGLERHLQYIVEHEPTLKNSDVLMIEFLNYFMVSVLGLKKLEQKSIEDLDEAFQKYFGQLPDSVQKQIINENNYIKENIKTDNLYYMDQGLVYEFKFSFKDFNKFSLRALNRDWYYFPTW